MYHRVLIVIVTVIVVWKLCKIAAYKAVSALTFHSCWGLKPIKCNFSVYLFSMTNAKHYGQIERFKIYQKLSPHKVLGIDKM